MSNLAISPQTPLKRLHGVGEVIERGLERLGISTVQGLLLFFPYRFEDYSNVVQIADLKPGNVTIHATVEMVRLKRTARRGRLHISWQHRRMLFAGCNLCRTTC